MLISALVRNFLKSGKSSVNFKQIVFDLYRAMGSGIWTLQDHFSKLLTTYLSIEATLQRLV